MASPTPISQTPSLTNRPAVSTQTIQQQRDRAAAEQAYAEQERRNQEIRRREEEERARDQDRAYADVSAAAETVNKTGAELERAAARYNSLVDEYNAAEGTAERNRLKSAIERARSEYNRLSGQYSAESQTYNTALTRAERSGAVMQGERIEYKREILKSPFEVSEAQLKAEQEFTALAADVNKKSAAVNKAGQEYNSLIDAYNAADSASQKQQIQSLIEGKAAEYNTLSAELEKTAGKYNTALRSAQDAGYLDKSAGEFSYKAQSITPEFSGPKLSKSEQNAINSINALTAEVNTKSAAVNKAGQEYNALIDDFNNAESYEKKKQIQPLIESKAAEYNTLSGELQKSVDRYNFVFDNMQLSDNPGSTAQRISYTAQTLAPEFITTQTPVGDKSALDKLYQGVFDTVGRSVEGGISGQPQSVPTASAPSEPYYPIFDLFNRAGEFLDRESKNLMSGFVIGGLTLAGVGHSIRGGVNQLSTEGIPNNPLTQEYELPGGIKWQPQSTAAQDAERERKRQEDEFNSRIQAFGEAADYFEGVSKDLAGRRPDDAALAQGISDFMKFNQGEAQADKAFVMDGAVSISDEGVSFNRPSVYLTGAAAITAGATVGLAAIGAGGAAAAVPEGAALAGANTIRGGGTATVTAAENQAVNAIGGTAAVTGKQEAAAAFTPSEIGGGTIEMFTQNEVISNPLVNTDVEIRYRNAVIPELISGGVSAFAPEMRTAERAQFGASEIQVTGNGFRQGNPSTLETINAEGYPVNIDKINKAIAYRSGGSVLNITDTELGYGNTNANDDLTGNRAGYGLLNRAQFENQNRYNNRFEDETRNRYAYEFWFRTAPAYRFSRPKAPRLPDIDIDLKQKGEKKKGGKKKSGKSVLVEHYLPSAKDFIGSLDAPAKKRKGGGTDLLTGRPAKKGKKNNLLF